CCIRPAWGRARSARSDRRSSPAVPAVSPATRSPCMAGRAGACRWARARWASGT
ncbi:MAG: hypothetical protein AVDCRST_MAG77-5004, partial [uncultured Chloroflexi bacterium]